MMNICIIGGGPTGLRIADKMSCKGYNVELYEREAELGGCWKVDWEDGLYREHSPRVMTSRYTETLKLAKELQVSTGNVYGNYVYTVSILFAFFYSNMDTSDLAKVIGGLRGVKKDDKRTLRDWMDDRQLSGRGKKAMRKLALSVSTNENEILVYPLFTAINGGTTSNFLQFKENDLWIQKWEEKLASRPNVTIFKGRAIDSLHVKGKKIHSCKSGKKVIAADIFVCCVPLYSLQGLLEKCSSSVKENWGDFKTFKDYCIKSSYSGIGFQLHFGENTSFPNTWTANSHTDWCIEIVDITRYSNIVSKAGLIKQVLSCVIVDTNAMSSHLGKTPNQLTDMNEIINESLRQISLSFGTTIAPKHVTVADGVFYDTKNNFWEMKYSAFHPTAGGELDMAGNLENLYSVGPHNFYEISVLENAIRSADIFVNNF
jgi:hypothetical protein